MHLVTRFVASRILNDFQQLNKREKKMNLFERIRNFIDGIIQKRKKDKKIKKKLKDMEKDFE